MRVNIPSWSVGPLLKEAGVHGIKVARLNGFPELTQDEVEMLNKLVFKRIKKLHVDEIIDIKSKKDLRKLFKSITFDQIVYQELGTIQELA